jgi:hypothetical protein
MTQIVARSMSSAGDICYLALRHFGALMIEKNVRLSDLTTREDNHDVSKLDERDCRCSNRHGGHGERGSGGKRREVPGLERRVDAQVSPGSHVGYCICGPFALKLIELAEAFRTGQPKVAWKPTTGQ